ncbi:hypothetical protein GTP45_01020 [Pseudoduganella sp. FT55W]|uniref:Uncharacterized protein n=1 Tax=Duganella rivi TaxID=2666083 RepID=A0A7X4GL08_9BURK|nr:hypothetical protein [Duganella rivi]MYM65413.1 hypothetical protein [Duganella rivi]
MTKTAAPAVEAPAVAPATTPNTKPYAINLHDYPGTVLAEAAVHMRNGYICSPDISPQFFSTNGQIAVTLVLGSPDQETIDRANKTTGHALELQEIDRQREVEAAARKMMADMQRAEAKAKLDAQIADQTNALRRLKDQAAKL